MAMSNHPCNCSTCEYSNTGTHGFRDCTKLSHWLTKQEYEFTKELSCLSHSNAREYLMRDVITELQRSFDIRDNRTAREAIALIRDGVGIDQ